MKIKMLVMYVDGTLTDGKIYIGADGEVMKAFNVKDGYAISHLKEYGIIPVIITGRESEIVKYRAKELGVTELYQGVKEKLSVLKEIAEKYGISSEEIAYIGDDLNDLECMKYCGYSGCPYDAVSEVKDAVKYFCRNSGGEGALREYIDFLCNLDFNALDKE